LVLESAISNLANSLNTRICLKSSEDIVQSKKNAFFSISRGVLMHIRYYFIALLGIFACITSAEAAETDKPMVTFGGFGSLGVSHSSMSSGDYVVDSGIPKGPGLSENWSATNDTRIAGHMAAQYTPKVSVVLQVDSEYHIGNTYEPEVEFVNVKYAFTPDAYFRVGRILLPTFLESENRDVGYTYAWIHPPIEVYRQESIAHCDGADVNYRSQIGEAENSIKAISGRSLSEMGDSQTTISFVIQTPVGNFRYDRIWPDNRPRWLPGTSYRLRIYTDRTSRIIGEGQRFVRWG